MKPLSHYMDRALVFAWAVAIVIAWLLVILTGFIGVP